MRQNSPQKQESQMEQIVRLLFDTRSSGFSTPRQTLQYPVWLPITPTDGSNQQEECLTYTHFFIPLVILNDILCFDSLSLPRINLRAHTSSAFPLTTCMDHQYVVHTCEPRNISYIIHLSICTLQNTSMICVSKNTGSQTISLSEVVSNACTSCNGGEPRHLLVRRIPIKHSRDSHTYRHSTQDAAS